MVEPEPTGWRGHARSCLLSIHDAPEGSMPCTCGGVESGASERMSDVKAALPSDVHLQCPGCGTPVDATEFVVQRTPTTDQGFGLLLTPCGHLVTLDLIRDAWGIDIPEPDPMRVEYDPQA